jgi:hypothetical protein
MMRLLAHFIELAEAAGERGVRPEQIAALDVMRPLARMSEDIGEDALDRFAELEARIEQAFAGLQMETVDAA